MLDDSQQDDSQNQLSQMTGGSTSKVVTPPEPTPNGVLDTAQAQAQDASASSGGLPGNLTAPTAAADTSAAPAPATTAPMASPAPASVGDEDLLKLKQDALQQLSPLVSHLEQTPEERFRTTMMMIQATDDHSKIKDAYEAAQQIKDDKARAQALLDVVNEINYFTQHEAGEESQPQAQAGV